MCLAAYPPKFKAGDEVRVVDPAYKNWANDRLFIFKPYGEKGFHVARTKEASYPSTWFRTESLAHAYPDTPAGRKQEQLDIIAEKESILAETQKAIEAARAKIVEIDNRPPSVGDVYAYGSSNYTIIQVFEFGGKSYTNYQTPSGAVHCVEATTWMKDYTRVS